MSENRLEKQGHTTILVLDRGCTLQDLEDLPMKSPQPKQSSTPQQKDKQRKTASVEDRAKIAKAKKALYDYWKD